jgi:hypothetical protein
LRPRLIVGILPVIVPEKPPITPEQVQALNVVQELLPFRDYLAGVCLGSTHGNARLQMIDVLLVLLASFFNPLVRTQRIIEELSSQQWMRQKCDLQDRIPRSTLSDALKRFDPEMLRPLMQQLVRQVPALGRRDVNLATITRRVVAADGSYFRLAGEVAWAIGISRKKDGSKQYAARLNLQLDVSTFAAEACSVSGGEDASEPEAFARDLKPQVIYVVDRNFCANDFIRAVLGANSNLVLRLRERIHYDVLEERPLRQEDRERGVRSDSLIRFTGPKSEGNGDARSCRSKPVKQVLRRVVVWEEHNQQEIVLITDLLDAPAWVIGELYRLRWQVELFFKWLKSWGKLDHLLSQSAAGVTLQLYVAVIGALLLHIATGRRVSKYTLFWVDCVIRGQATVQEMEAGLARRERERELERARLARKKEAAKKPA